ncbi:hypothetical protein ACJZ2D_012445 [Fusarium nematophilum]
MASSGFKVQAQFLALFARQALRSLGRGLSSVVHRWTYRPLSHPRTVAVVGGSFASTYLAQRLAHTLPSGFRVVLVEKHSHFHFAYGSPHFAVVSGLESKGFIPYDNLTKGAPRGIFKHIHGEALDIEDSNNVLKDGTNLDYDYLAIATGAAQPPPARVDDSGLREGIARLRGYQQRIQHADRIVVIGSGAVGVELATEIRQQCPEKRITLIHLRDQLLPRFEPKVHDCVANALERMNIELILGERPVLPADAGMRVAEAALEFSSGLKSIYDLVSLLSPTRAAMPYEESNVSEGNRRVSFLALGDSRGPAKLTAPLLNVGLYTTFSLALLKAFLLVLEVIFNLRSSRQTRLIRQGVIDGKNLLFWHHEFTKQMASLKNKLFEWHRRFDEPPHRDDRRESLQDTPESSTSQAAIWPRVIRRKHGDPSRRGVRKLAWHITRCLRHNDIARAIPAYKELMIILSKVPNHVDRDLAPQRGHDLLLNRKRVEDIEGGIEVLTSKIVPDSRIDEICKEVTDALREKKPQEILVCRGLAFNGINGDAPGDDQQCRVADADIFGNGVRSGTWLQTGFLFLFTLVGSFHNKHTAVKELGSGLVIMHVSLSFAFVGPLLHKELSPLLEKETLAARWQVGTVVLAQLLGLITIGVLVSSFSRDALISDRCRCFSVFWWSRFGNCSDGLPIEVLPFWIYYGLRWLSTARSWCFSLTRTKFFDKALKLESRPDPSSREPRADELTCEACERPIPRRLKQDETLPVCAPCPRCKRCVVCDTRKAGQELGALEYRSYSEMPTTVGQLYLEYGAFGCLSLVAAESTIAMHSIRLTSPVYSIGQITAIVVAGSTTIRVIWLTSKTLYSEG